MPKYVIRGWELDPEDVGECYDRETFIFLEARTDDLARHRMETKYTHLVEKELYKKVR